MTNIPEEVMHLCILPRLPAISLIRFKCVSKTWLTLITSPDFIRLHHRDVRSSDKNRLLIVYATPFQRFHLHNLDSSSTPPLQLPYPKPATCTTPMVVDVVASCEFFLLISCSLRHSVLGKTIVHNMTCEAHQERSDQSYIYNRYCNGLPRNAVVQESGNTYESLISYKTEFYGLFLLNPATGSYYKIPHQNPPNASNHITYGLCLDEANNDCKIIIGNESFGVIMVYSLKTNLWKSIERKFNRFLRVSNGAVIGHLYHRIYCSTDNENRICCFDILAEQWTNDVPLPNNCAPGNPNDYDLCVLDGLLCVFGRNDFGNHSYQVWVMKEYGVKESWVKLMSTVPINFQDCTPMTYRTGSRHELLCTRPLSNLVWYNIRDKEAKQIEFDGCKWVSGHVCKGSLFNFS